MNAALKDERPIAERISQAILKYQDRQNFLKSVNPLSVSEDRLVLASLLSSFAPQIADLKYDAEKKWFHAKNAEIEKYLEYRKTGSQKDAEVKAKYDCTAFVLSAIEADRMTKKAQLLYDSATEILNGLASYIKNLETERFNSK